MHSSAECIETEALSTRWWQDHQQNKQLQRWQQSSSAVWRNATHTSVDCMMTSYTGSRVSERPTPTRHLVPTSSTAAIIQQQAANQIPEHTDHIHLHFQQVFHSNMGQYSLIYSIFRRMISIFSSIYLCCSGSNAIFSDFDTGYISSSSSVKCSYLPH